MRQLSIGRSFRLALAGLALVLAVLAGVGVAQLYDARRDLEQELSSAYRLEAAAGGLLAAGIVEEALARTTPPGERAAAVRAARTEYESAAQRAHALAADDEVSDRLVDEAVAAQRRLRERDASRRLAARPPIEQLVERQRERRALARADATHDSRRALIAMGAFGLLAFAIALVVATAILSALRRPLDELVDASGRLAGGDLGVRVRAGLPGELAALGEAFNAMAADLERAQASVARERERLSETVESLGDGLLVVEEGRVTSANARAGELLGSTPLGTPAGEIEALPDPLDALAGEVLVDHGRRTLAIHASRLGYGSRGLVWTVRDVSEHARLERLKSEFVATASHELRSPLTSIKGFVELLHASPGLSERQRDWVEIVLVSANRLVDLVNDLLDVARVEAGRLEIDARPTDVAEVGREVARLLEPRVDARGQRLELDLPGDLPPALADADRLRQILTNLLTNAHQYAGDDGTIALRARAARDAVELEVADTGPGMAPEALERVFERFYRGPEAASAQTAGTGLGLAIVRSLVDLHGGSVEVDSQLGAGTTFTVRLPRAASGDAGDGRSGSLAGPVGH